MRHSKLLVTLSALAATLVGGAAQAGVYYDSEIPAGGYATVTYSNPYQFTLNVGPFGAGETFQSATLNIWLADDSFFDLNERYSDTGSKSETATFRLDSTTFTTSDDEVDGGVCLLGGSIGSSYNSSCLPFYDLFTFSLSKSLAGDGKVSVKLGAKASGQDFYFKKADLTINTTKVPEPATLGLLGLGMIGVGLSRRRKRTASAA